MKTRLQRAYLEASIIGDSHAMSVWKHLAPAINFRHSMTAPAKHFDGRFFDDQDGRLHISSRHLSEAYPRADADVLQVMANARTRLDGQLQAILDAGLPVISSLGAASYRFARKVAARDPDSGEVFSRKILRAAASEHVEHFVAFHRELLPHVPSVTFMLGACRFPESQKAPWLAYDEAITARMTEAGIGIIDVRQATGDDDLRMLPEFEADDALHGNDRWSQTVADRIFAIVGEPERPATADAGTAGGS